MVLLACVAAMRLHAQEPPAATSLPDELVQYRRMFELRSLTNARTLTEQYANALAGIVRDAAAEGDYDQALAAQRRREQLVELYSKSLDDTALTNVILLKPADARVNGAVTYDRNQNALVSWKTAGSIASWDVTRITPGTYDVTLTYATADIGDVGRLNPFAVLPDLTTGGEFEFYEDSSLAGAEQNHRTGQIISTGGWTNWKSLTLPAIQITRTSARFALKITKARGSGGVMNLRGVRLSPPSALAAAAEAPTNPQDAAVPSVDEFAVLQLAYVDHLRQAVTPVLNAYADTVKTLAAKVANDPELAGDYNAEVKRVAQLVEDPLSILAGRARGPAQQGMNANGFRELRGATFVAAARNSGDCFKVKQGSEEFLVRLLWVACPPSDQADKKRLKECADYFGISEEDALAVGQQAQNFTAGFLAGKNLTLLTRDKKDEGENLLVSVQPEGVGDFAAVLVDHGLAMIKPADAPKGPARAHHESVLSELRDREKAARARKVPVGAWARKSEQ